MSPYLTRIRERSPSCTKASNMAVRTSVVNLLQQSPTMAGASPTYSGDDRRITGRLLASMRRRAPPPNKHPWLAHPWLTQPRP
jgi:hypothetical protein